MPSHDIEVTYPENWSQTTESYGVDEWIRDEMAYFQIAYVASKPGLTKGVAKSWEAADAFGQYMALFDDVWVTAYKPPKSAQR